MRSFKKAIISVLLFVAFIFAFSIAIYEPYAHSELYVFCDSNLRKSMSGKIDFLILGSSPGYRAFIPQIYDDIIQTYSYNASGAYMPWTGRIALLKEEIDRQPLKSVVIEISYDSLLGNVKSPELVEGHVYIEPRIGSFIDRVNYFFSNVTIDTFEKYYTNILQNGGAFYLNWARSKLDRSKLDYIHNVNYRQKGYLPYDENVWQDLTVDKKTFLDNFGKKHISTEFREDNLNILKEMIDICHQKNIDVFFAVTPYANSYISWFNNNDEFDKKLSDFANENGCYFWDFNLMKGRFEQLSDKTDWWDGQHMSKHGAEVFSKMSAEIFRKFYRGENVEDCFYNNYEEMMLDSPYWQYMGN